MSVTIIEGDALNETGKLDPQSVDCVVTSPPYWNLRDYGVPGQMGSEPTPADYVVAMVEVFKTVKKALKLTGTLWLNMGDCYTGSGCGWGGKSEPRGTHGHIHGKDAGKISKSQKPPAGLKRKELVGMPWRLAFALQEAGWYLRQDIIWNKPNPMPESVGDRCTKSHEYMFLLSKSAKYYFDSDAIRERAKWFEENGAGSGVGFGYGYDKQHKPRVKTKMPDGWDTGEGAHGNYHRDGRQRGQKTTLMKGGVSAPEYDKWKWENRTDGSDGCRPPMTMKDREYNPKGRNKRSVWTVPTAPYKGAHFATFPPELIRPCILAGCPPGGTVLDPFAGSGTTGMVAEEEGRHSILIELNPEYVELARKRTAQCGVFFPRAEAWGVFDE